MAVPDISFRLLERSDFPMLAEWLATPAVHRWWNHEFTAEAIENDFGGAVDGTEKTDVYIAELIRGGGGVDSQAFGLIQYYQLHDYDESIDELTEAGVVVPPSAGSIDYLIGRPDLLGQGLGRAMISAFVEMLWRRHPQLRELMVPVVTANTSSWGALAAAGFTRQADIDLPPDNPIDDVAHVLMVMNRPS